MLRLRMAMHHVWNLAALAAGTVLIVGCAASRVPVPEVPLRVDWIGEDEELDAHAEIEVEGEFEPGAGSRAIGAFVGGSSDMEGGNGLVLGLDYGHRLTDRFGVGVFAERAAGQNRSFATGEQAFWASPLDIVLFTGVGAEVRDSEWEAILRFGVEYEILYPGGWVLAPSVFIDIGETEDLLIYGLTIGKFL